MTSQQDVLQEHLEELRTASEENVVAKQQRKQILKKQAANADRVAAKSKRLITEQDKTKAELDSQVTASQVAISDLPHHLETAYQQLAQKVDKMNTLRKQLETSSKDEVRQSEALTHIENLHCERDSLQERLDEAERRLDELLQTNSKGSDGDDIGVQIYQKYDLAMDDLRAVKSENRQLREQLADAQNNATASGPPNVSSSGGFDWESQKAQLLAQLDGIDPNDAEQVQEKYKAKEAIRATEQAVAERDRQIAELQAQLEDKSQQQPAAEEVIPGAHATADLLDQDELIKLERNNLRRIQDECREKLRQAEIDISVERAKIARERNELERKLSDLEDEHGKPNHNSGEAGAESSGKQGRRWLAKLGLNGNDD